MDEQGDLKERLTRYADDVAHYEREGDAALVAEAAARISALEGELLNRDGRIEDLECRLALAIADAEEARTAPATEVDDGEG